MVSVIDCRASSEFIGVDSSSQVPDEDILGRFQNLMIRKGIQEELFRQVVELLQSNARTFFLYPFVFQGSHERIANHSKQESIVRDQVVFFAVHLSMKNSGIRDQVVFLIGKSGQKAASYSRSSCMLTTPKNFLERKH